MEQKPAPVRAIELKTSELLEVLNRLKFEDWEEFEFNGTSFLLILTGPDDTINNESPAVFHFSTAMSGFDIYLRENLTTEEKKRSVFHEALEATLQARGLESDEAHKITLAEEEKVFGKRKD